MKRLWSAILSEIRSDPTMYSLIAFAVIFCTLIWLAYEGITWAF